MNEYEKRWKELYYKKWKELYYKHLEALGESTHFLLDMEDDYSKDEVWAKYEEIIKEKVF